MAVTIQCPRCTHEQKVDDEKVGQEVKCKICHHAYKAGGKSEAKSKLAPTPKKAASDAVKAGTPGAVQAKKPPVMADKKPDKKPTKKTDDDDDDEARPTPRREREEKSSSAGLFMAVG